MKTKLGPGSSAAVWLWTAVVLAGLPAADRASAQDEVGQVTLLAGAPRMVGESIRPLQAILTGQQLETGESDAAGVLVEDIVFHVGVNSDLSVIDEPGRKRIVIGRGFVVFYTDPATANEVMVETPFGRLTAYPGSAAEDGSGWFSVRHDPEEPSVSPAVSTFAAMEGTAEVVGTAPEAGPYTLLAGQRWRIVQGQIPGPPEEGDERAAAEELRDMLHRQAAEMLRAQAVDITRLATVDLGRTGRLPLDVIVPEQQNIIDANATMQDRTPSQTPTPVPRLPTEQPEPEERLALGDRTAIAAGAPNTAAGQFVSYAGSPADADWNAYLTAVDGNPAFAPIYFTEFANGGFSYIQLVGSDAQVATSGGETFLATTTDGSSGWATYTPQVAIADADFDPNSALAGVVTEGFRAIARGEHLAGGGAIGGDGVDSASAFAVVSGSLIQLNPTLPPGYPLFDRASDTTGLEVNGEAVSDQIAALGAGLNPQDLSQAGPQLLFISDSNTDALGNAFNFDGEAISPTDLNLPGDRQVQTDRTGAAGTATPLTGDADNTVGIQFAGTGETVAIIHHTGLRNPDDASLPTSDHFEIERGDRESIVRWRDDGRVTGSDGQVLEAEDLNQDPTLRDELFALIGSEVNNLVPTDRHTVTGPAIAPAGAGAARLLRRQPGRLVRVGDAINRRLATVHRAAASPATRSWKLRPLTSARGRLLRDTNARVTRRHLGRVSPRP